MDIQTQMQRMLESLVSQGRERGVQLAVYYQGKLVVDAFAGIADPATGQRVDGETLFPVFSATKAIAATLVHQLVERGLVSYDTPIAELWPGFAAHGKSGITVRHALGHTAGLQYMPMGTGYRELDDWGTMCRLMADMTPASGPGEQQVYHAVTFSWLVGEVACRVTGRTFGELLDEQINRPLGIDSLFVGIPDEVESRVAILDEIFEPGKEPSTETNAQQTVAGWLMPLHTMMNRPDARRACIPASNGIMNARSLARHYAALLPGGVDGVELLPPARVRQATMVHEPKVPPAEGPRHISLGYFVGAEGADWGSRSTIFGHGGYGGAIGFADPERGLAVGFTKNLYSAKGATRDVLIKVRETLGIA
jgi:CubicO group peptidase (beta-lactamase class C family)